VVDVVELKPKRAADHKAQIESALPAALEELAERDRVKRFPTPMQQRHERPLGQSPVQLIILAHLDQLDPGAAPDQLLIVIDVIHERGAQSAHGHDDNPHDGILSRNMESNQPERHINIHFSPEDMGGKYANFANVSHSDYEFTITFARVDHEVEDEEIPGVVVSRINLAPKFMRELIDALQDNYSKWQTREGIKNLPEYGGTSEYDEDESSD
jgi:hypothetical protein